MNAAARLVSDPATISGADTPTDLGDNSSLGHGTDLAACLTTDPVVSSTSDPNPDPKSDRISTSVTILGADHDSTSESLLVFLHPLAPIYTWTKVLALRFFLFSVDFLAILGILVFVAFEVVCRIGLAILIFLAVIIFLILLTFLTFLACLVFLVYLLLLACLTHLVHPTYQIYMI